jgi:hypothetical protein
MVLKLQGVNDSLIMESGQRAGLTFLMYIHFQIGTLKTTSLASQMAMHINFITVTR